MFYQAVVRNANGASQGIAYINLESGLILKPDAEGIHVSTASCPLNHPENQIRVLSELKTLKIEEILDMVKTSQVITNKIISKIPEKKTKNKK